MYAALPKVVESQHWASEWSDEEWQAYNEGWQAFGWNSWQGWSDKPLAFLRVGQRFMLVLFFTLCLSVV